jgi:hypothetical protein
MATRNEAFLITCGSYPYSPGQQQITGSPWVHFNFGPPTTADDCARLCNWISTRSSYQHNYVTNNPGCDVFEWTLSGISCVCNMWSGIPSSYQPTKRIGVVVAGLSQATVTTDFAPPAVQQYRKRSLLPSVAGAERVHARDALSEGDHRKADFIIPCGFARH